MTEFEKTVEDLEKKPQHLELLNVLYDKLKKMIKNQEIKPINIIIIAEAAMRLLGKIKNLSGYEKKAMVIELVKKLVREASLSDDDKMAIEIIINYTLPVIIDEFYKISKGGIDFGAIKKSCKRCFK